MSKAIATFQGFRLLPKGQDATICQAQVNGLASTGYEEQSLILAVAKGPAFGICRLRTSCSQTYDGAVGKFAVTTQSDPEWYDQLRSHHEVMVIMVLVTGSDLKRKGPHTVLCFVISMVQVILLLICFACPKPSKLTNLWVTSIHQCVRSIEPGRELMWNNRVVELLRGNETINLSEHSYKQKHYKRKGSNFLLSSRLGMIVFDTHDILLRRLQEIITMVMEPRAAIHHVFSSQSTDYSSSPIDKGRCLRAESECEKCASSHKKLPKSSNCGRIFHGYFGAVNTMAEQNVPTQPPTRTDEQIVPRSQWLTIGKSNLLFNAQKIQKNPIFQISVDILSNTNFFQAFTASANVPAIYLQQFWNTMKYNEKTGVYSCQVDEQWFDLSADLLRKALAITPVNPTHPFELPPSGNTVIDFVNELGYPEPVEIVSNIRVNYVYQPWRAILTLINQCLTGKTSGSDKPRHPVLQMLWGIVTQTNVDHAELIWEEFTQGIQTFFSHKASHKASLKNPKKKVTPLLIPYGRFSKVIIYYLASNNNIHRRPDSAVHHTGDDFILGNLKFVPKGESVEVFGMAIPDPLITEAIQQSSYYPKYLEMVAENTKKTPQESASVQPATRRTPPKKPTTTTPVKPSKPALAPTKKPSKRKLPQKVRKGKPTFQLVAEEDEAQQESIPQEEGDDPDLELAKKMSMESHQEKGEGEGDDADMERAIKLSLDPAFLPKVGHLLEERDQTPHDSETRPSSQPEDNTSEKLIHESSSTSDSERTKSETEAAAPKGDKDQDEVDTSTVTSGVSIPVSDPEKHMRLWLDQPDP
ncbi:hypothetical protein Tco_0429328 [Tanacetum coccineum]